MSGSILIWDLDGTVIDSYDSIVECLVELSCIYNIVYSPEYIFRYVKKYSVHSFLQMLAKQQNVDFKKVKNQYSEIGSTKDIFKIRTMPNVPEVLALLDKSGVKNFMFTHKGITTFDILRALDLQRYFVEIITSKNGFARKPNPEALDYLINKYRMDKRTTYYIGDREIDVGCARNAGIGSILFTENCSVSSADHIVSNLFELLNFL